MQWQRFAEQMAVLARDLLEKKTVQETLDAITAAAVNLVEGCDAAGVLAVRKGKAITLSSCGDRVEASDRTQGELGEGPCYDLARREDAERTYRIEDMTRPRPDWPAYAKAARELGIGSMTGILLYTDNEDFGALNLYARRPGTFTEDIETAGWILASHAAVALSSARTIDQLEHAMETRHAIGEAMGILMERHAMSEDDAFDVLRRLSQHHNIKLRDVAQTFRAEHDRR
ncbi:MULTISPECIES: GAF and ANTAR domain-containing protein [Streptomyces violaceoruber group]|uniref:GAF and ANTAR domain-containing protein n=1 Tax=Streptomyces rubrogriseus TaxID=194673 RepID=A0A6G3TSG2_9ACTN|nr:GAF and ANTAR domain-containing protein [Streptomyces rubrogriseus]NEC39523.1 GAF and ANTAR domain-containing protein [Streptomyces rubrogriseus]